VGPERGGGGQGTLHILEILFTRRENSFFATGFANFKKRFLV